MDEIVLSIFCANAQKTDFFRLLFPIFVRYNSEQLENNECINKMYN